MGAYLDKPVEEKNPTTGAFENGNIWWGACSMQGWRCGMEDAHITDQFNQDGKIFSLFCVFDGHGGKEVALQAEREFKQVLLDQKEFKEGKYEQALRIAFLKFDQQVEKKDYANDSGTTSCVVLITPTQIYCANAGDSRGILYTGDKVVELSEDHKPDNKDEIARINKAGHMVEDSRVDGNLALSRAFGDFQYKDQSNIKQEEQAVTSNPDITVNERKHGQDKFIILACDGIWDCLSNEECATTFNEKMDKHKITNNAKTAEPVASMLGDILATNTDDGIGTDNMTCILILFRDYK